MLAPSFSEVRREMEREGGYLLFFDCSDVKKAGRMLSSQEMVNYLKR